ncbi:hypothetical protein [Chromobacterium sp. ASV23]|uniref:hypothetical protein n=1 Tax=Chromobacterium sp. ASV23 TaxID=2795110 RepID=UPI0018EC60DC|nr:hypothetical protein [Chromobacterium sp. ASV23]
MSFTSVPFFITYADNPELALCAEDSMKGAPLVLRPLQGNMLALFNVDFVSGLFGLATSGNQLVIGAEQIELGSPLKMQLLDDADKDKQRWDIFSAPGDIISYADPTLAIGLCAGTDKLRPLELTELDFDRYPQWILRPFTVVRPKAAANYA